MTLTIVKQRAYVWRVGRNREAHFRWMPYYDVVYPGGTVVTGGYDSGNNVRSGRAQIPLKRTAQAFIDGYNGVTPAKRLNHKDRMWHRMGADRARRDAAKAAQ